MQRAGNRASLRWQGQINRLARQLGLKRRGLQRLLAGADRGINASLQRVQLRAILLALLGAHLAQGTHQARHPALLAKLGHTHLFQRGKIGSCLN